MTRARVTHELGMLFAVCLLQVWRFTGVPFHEALAALLGVAVFVHVLMQRSWVAANVRKLFAPAAARSRINVALNGGLFVAFTAAMASGIAISKVLRPQAMHPAEFLRWHEIHDTSSKLVLLFVGLHLALNWDSLRASMKVSATKAPARATIGLRNAAYAASIAIAATIAVGATYGIESALPAEEFVLVTGRDGKVRRIPPPHDLVELRKDQRSPNVSAGLPKLAATIGILAITGVAGRKVLRLRL